MVSEADTCRKYILPRIYAAGWTDDQISEQRTFTDGRIVVVGNKVRRKRQKRADYLLAYTSGLTLAVIEAKADYKLPADGLEQAKEYAQMLDLKFAYSSNGLGIVEFNFISGTEGDIDTFPSPDELWRRYCQAEDIEAADKADRVSSPVQMRKSLTPRYYQEIAINRVIKSILDGKKRVLLTMATGTGKTMVAFQICWKLWSTRWNQTGEHRRPKILYLSDRTVLVEDPKDRMFAPFGDARFKIEQNNVNLGRDIYFALYQSLDNDPVEPLYTKYPKDFFDLIIVDECHRGSATKYGNWRGILEYFSSAYQLGMTATPLRQDNKDTYQYFGNPVYMYTLKQGIEDGFLAPYKVHRVLTNVDAAGWRPTKGELDRYGREIPDELYETPDFERVIVLRARTETIAKHISNFMAVNGRMNKTLVFCVDQEHALEMRKALVSQNQDLVRKYPDFVCRVTADEGDIGKGHLSRFQELETEYPVILTTSQLLTTGIDAPMVKNVVIVKVINSMVDFKQTIGRGTRVRADYGKYYFNIMDYTGSATRLFADPEFDGEPALITEEEINAKGETIRTEEQAPDHEEPIVELWEDPELLPVGGEVAEYGKVKKFYVDDTRVEIAHEQVLELDSEGKKLRTVHYAEWTQEKLREMFTSAAELRSKWTRSEERKAVLQAFAERGIDTDYLAQVMKMPEVDPVDLLCHIAFSSPLRSRMERAERLRKQHKNFFDEYENTAKEILNAVLDKYTDYGASELGSIDILKVKPISDYGNISEIARLFGGPHQMRDALERMQQYLYTD